MIWIRQKTGTYLYQNKNGGQNKKQILSFIITKLQFVPSLELRKPKISRRKVFRQSFPKNIGKNMQVKKQL